MFAPIFPPLRGLGPSAAAKSPGGPKLAIKVGHSGLSKPNQRKEVKTFISFRGRIGFSHFRFARTADGTQPLVYLGRKGGRTFPGPFRPSWPIALVRCPQ